MDVIAPLRETLLASKSADPWERFGRWYFSEADTRPISPWSTVGLSEYLGGLAARGDRDSLDYALSLSKSVPAWTVKLMALRAKLGVPSPAPATDND